MAHAAMATGVRPPTEPPAHGGGLIAAARAFPAATLPWMDLSTGINPHPYPVPPLPPGCWTRLPEPEEIAALEAAAGRAYGAHAGWDAVAAPGTSALIALLARLFPGPAAIVGPTYGEYHAGWPAALVVPGPHAFGSCPVRIVCQPDNPTGTVHDPGALVPATDGVTIVDESYADFLPGAAVEAVSPARPGLVVLRSFGKAYGLAGLRLGFALAAPALAARLRQALGPWPVSGPAIRIGTAALSDPAWHTGMAARLEQDRARLEALLRQAGFAAVAGTPLFSVGRSTAPWFQRLGGQGILVRIFADRPGLVRFGHPADEAGWRRLEHALTNGA